MKVRMKRVVRSEPYFTVKVDADFMPGELRNVLTIGEGMFMTYSEIDGGFIVTSPVKSISRDGDLIVVKTKNSTYHLKEGWEDTHAS